MKLVQKWLVFFIMIPFLTGCSLLLKPYHPEASPQKKQEIPSAQTAEEETRFSAQEFKAQVERIISANEHNYTVLDELLQLDEKKVKLIQAEKKEQVHEINQLTEKQKPLIEKYRENLRKIEDETEHLAKMAQNLADPVLGPLAGECVKELKKLNKMEVEYIETYKDLIREDEEYFGAIERGEDPPFYNYQPLEDKIDRLDQEIQSQLDLFYEKYESFLDKTKNNRL